MDEEMTDTGILLAEMLFGLASDDYIVQAVETATLLEAAGYQGHVYPLEALQGLIVTDEIDALEVTVQVDEILRENVRLAILECGVQYDPDIDMGLLQDLTRAILLFDPTETPQALIDVIEMADDDQTALINALRYLTGRDETEWIPVIETPGVGLIDRMKDVAQSALDNTPPSTDFTRAVDYGFIQRLARLAEVEEADHELLGIAQSMESVPNAELLFIQRMPTLMDQSPKDVVNHLYSISSLSNTAFESTFTQVGHFLDELYEDPQQRLEVEQLRHALKATYQRALGDSA